jgi:hypothetical protein
MVSGASFTFVYSKLYIFPWAWLLYTCMDQTAFGKE